MVGCICRRVFNKMGNGKLHFGLGCSSIGYGGKYLGLRGRGTGDKRIYFNDSTIQLSVLVTVYLDIS
jgi:hypothetical protein